MKLTEGERVQWTIGTAHHTGRVMLYQGERVVVDSFYDAVLIKEDCDRGLVAIGSHYLSPANEREDGE